MPVEQKQRSMVVSADDCKEFTLNSQDLSSAMTCKGPCASCIGGCRGGCTQCGFDEITTSTKDGGQRNSTPVLNLRK